MASTKKSKNEEDKKKKRIKVVASTKSPKQEKNKDKKKKKKQNNTANGTTRRSESLDVMVISSSSCGSQESEEETVKRSETKKRSITSTNRTKKSNSKRKEQAEEDNEEGEAEITFRFPMARIKRIITREESGLQLNQDVVFLVNKATEKFIQQFCEEGYDCSVRDRKKSLGYKHLSSVVREQRRFDFLSDFVPDKLNAQDALAQMKLLETRQG
ncbi:hypothetical protein JCGZ_05538 [Jatropha curcas]|uniref:Transcription factor CBF/NF-Y/archaeal histone domain-containing protein n=1 Tax=Jatropha curcas TaxID=180498 RepID=A0A067L6H2_JATCU|nr:DNA polymerase epsilon subunit C isoform X2 [Jatropha curcas]KDP44071.1 hypothetical protein JCGZ_05538 [Jatropha curcas]